MASVPTAAALYTTKRTSRLVALDDFNKGVIHYQSCQSSPQHIFFSDFFLSTPTESPMLRIRWVAIMRQEREQLEDLLVRSTKHVKAARCNTVFQFHHKSLDTV